MSDAAANPFAPAERHDLGEHGRELILDARNIGVSFKVEGGQLEAVRDVSFQLHKGETIALVGESGSGKSVTARTVMGLLGKPRHGGEAHAHRLRRRGHRPLQREAEAGAARQPHLDDLPGADVVAEPGLHRRPADLRDPPSPQQDQPQGGDGAGAAPCSRRCRSRSRRRGSGNTRTSFPAASASA